MCSDRLESGPVCISGMRDGFFRGFASSRTKQPEKKTQTAEFCRNAKKGVVGSEEVDFFYVLKLFGHCSQGAAVETKHFFPSLSSP